MANYHSLLLSNFNVWGFVFTNISFCCSHDRFGCQPIWGCKVKMRTMLNFIWHGRKRAREKNDIWSFYKTPRNLANWASFWKGANRAIADVVGLLGCVEPQQRRACRYTSALKVRYKGREERETKIDSLYTPQIWTSSDKPILKIFMHVFKKKFGNYCICSSCRKQI